MTTKAMRKILYSDDLKKADRAVERKQAIAALLKEGKSDTLIAARMQATRREIELVRKRLKGQQP